MTGTGRSYGAGEHRDKETRYDRLWKPLWILGLLMALALSIVGLVRELGTSELARQAVAKAEQAAEKANQAAEKAEAAAGKAAQALDQSVKAMIATLDLTIEYPVDGEVITDLPYDDMHGKFSGELPPGYSLRVLPRDSYNNYFLMNPPTQVLPATKAWSQSNVRLGTPGRWQLSVCLADRAATEWLDARVARQDWSGFPILPPGASVLREVTVTKIEKAAGQEEPASIKQTPAAAPQIELTIEAPTEGEVIGDLPYDDMHGKFSGELPPGYSLRVLARDSYHYFLMNPPTQVLSATKAWSQSNVRLGTPGRWQLSVCLADRAATEWLDARVARQDWSGFPTLPVGLTVLRTVNVAKK